MFRSADMRDNLAEVVETEDCKVLRMSDPSGDGLMTIYRVYDGVYLMYNDFHMTHCYSRFASTDRLFCIDHCLEGRIEHRTNRNMHYYMESGDLRLDRRVHHSGDMFFPVSHYHGITIGFLMDRAEPALRKAFAGVSVDLAALAEKFCSGDDMYILRKHASMLVTERDKRIIEIAACVGYDNPSKFAAAFRSVFGMTPAEYRNDRR